MELGEKLLKARTDAGLSQRQLCGDVITRNMLSQIEHGTAKPSMKTLQYLAERLGKPVSYFLEEEFDTSLQEDLNRLQSAQTALTQGKHRLASDILEGVQGTIPELKRKKILLMAKIPGAVPEALCQELPSLDEELYLRAVAAFDKGWWVRCLHLLESMENRTTHSWNLLRGKVFLEQDQPKEAVVCFLRAGESQEVYALLERCYRDMEDYKQAYFYAVKQKK